MSYGERSCLQYGRCDIGAAEQCNVDCSKYDNDHVTKPDSTPKITIKKDGIIGPNFRFRRH